MYNIHLLPALFGDAILIEYGTQVDPKYILIDGGPYYGYSGMMAGLKRVAPNIKTIELLIVTHTDIDHIDGIITFLNQSPLPITVKQIWFNGFAQINQPEIRGSILGALQGEYLSKLIADRQLVHNGDFGGKAVVIRDPNALPVINCSGFTLTLLTPSIKALQKLYVDWKKEIAKIEAKETVDARWQKETRYTAAPSDVLGGSGSPDKSIANICSIAFIGTYEGKSCLFAGDAPSDELLPVIQLLKAQRGEPRFTLDAWKLAHHGSQRSTTRKLAEALMAKHILVSSNGSIHHLPDEACIQNVVETQPGCVLYFNYTSEYNTRWKDPALQGQLNFVARYPTDDGKPGISIHL
ncbi:metallo-beta-lactamase superfamily protein [Chitinophaga skermanii]|uniref:Metallo-beta-lactamase superfamily protein n=1 Tax=Chitinophaga skermanii TaxID=331697 RepID=A0A327RB79_9BACT|nr:MBL fold metallo-hydrolase [Chitinophaga skermanii]RAJ11187.1 metallo-beta-lactamase superfamily protein [Chitinophaga skermanii]